MTSHQKDDGASLSVAVAEEIRVWMLRRRTTGEKLATALGKSPAWVSYRLNGQVDIKLSELEAIARALDVPITALLPQPADRTKGVDRLASPALPRTASAPRSNRLLPHTPPERRHQPAGHADSDRPRIPGTRNRRPAIAVSHAVGGAA